MWCRRGKTFSHLLHTSSSSSSSSSSSKKLLNKMLRSSKKKIWYQSPPQVWAPNQGSALRPPSRRDQEASGRCRVLNSLLLKSITDIITSGQVNHQLCDYSPEITKVCLSSDFSSCRVFWRCSDDSQTDDLIQIQFDRNASRIRYLITSQQIMAGLPPLVFLRDKQQAIAAQIDKLLQEADFGPEFLPDSPTERSFSRASSSVLFGVDHEALNRQITEWRQRCKGEGPGQTPPPPLTQEQITVFAEFRKQQIIKKRKKAAPPIDDDITPQDFLLARLYDIPPGRRGQAGEDEGEGDSKQEDVQLEEVMSQEDRKL